MEITMTINILDSIKKKVDAAWEGPGYYGFNDDPKRAAYYDSEDLLLIQAAFVYPNESVRSFSVAYTLSFDDSYFIYETLDEVLAEGSKVLKSMLLNGKHGSINIRKSYSTKDGSKALEEDSVDITVP